MWDDLGLPLELSEAEPGAGLRGSASPEDGRASLSLSPWGWGLLPICRFNNGNLHFTNERINSREIVFLATVALCFKGSKAWVSSETRQTSYKVCRSQGAISITQAGGEAWLHSRLGEAFSRSWMEEREESSQRRAWALGVRWGRTG